MIILDTTVLAYAVGDEHPLRAPARWILSAHQRRAIEATTTVEVIQEFMHLRARRRTRDDAAALALSFTDAFDVLSTSAEDLRVAADLFTRQERLGAFDAMLAAVAIRVRAEAIVSADRAFADIGVLRWIDLADRKLAHVLTDER